MAVAELGSFSAAAESLHLSQPAVTNRVQRLEAALRTRLLTRTSRKVETTPEGDVLLAQGSPPLGDLNEVLQGLLDTATQDSNRIVVASTPLTASILLPPLVRSYTDQHPGRDVILLDLSYQEVIDALLAGHAHMAILTGPADDRFLVEPVGTDDVVLVAPPQHPLTGRESISLEALSGQELLLIDQYQPLFDAMATAMEKRGLPLPKIHPVRSMGTVLGMFEAGMGLALMTRTTAKLRCAHGTTSMRVEGMDLQRVYSLVLPRRPQLTAPAKDFSDYLRASFVRQREMGEN